MNTSVSKSNYRINLGKAHHDEYPKDLTSVQLDSFYDDFLQENVLEKENKGLEGALRLLDGIKSNAGNMELVYQGYTLAKPLFTIKDCKLRGTSYSAALSAKFKLFSYDKDSPKKNKKVKNVTEGVVYMGDIPLMTPNGSFVINGTERTVVSQLHRSPGVFFEHDGGRMHLSRIRIYSARIIPYRGAWLDIEFCSKKMLWARIDRKRKIPVTIILRSLGLTDQEIIDKYHSFEKITKNTKGLFAQIILDRLKGSFAMTDILDDSGEIIVKNGTRVLPRHIKLIEAANPGQTSIRQKINPDYLIGKVLGQDIIDKESGEVVASLNSVISEDNIESILESSIKEFNVLFVNELDRGAYIADTLRADPAKSREEALIEIYRVIRPGEPPTNEAAENLFKALLFEEDRYDLSEVGRMKMNSRLGRKELFGKFVLEPQDLIDIIAELIRMKDSKLESDDIDSLANRRCRRVGEMIENQFRVGLIRVQRTIQEKLSHPDSESIVPQELINSRPISSAVNEFVTGNQLCQFMDLVNPLAGLTHMRRMSALGQGGLRRETAKFEVRDVHHTHYGRLCPIETPEGPNIGLINSLALYASINKYGFLVSPFRKVVDGKITEEVRYMSAFEESKYRIAQACIPTEDDHVTLKPGIVSCRYQGDCTTTDTKVVDYTDYTPKQIVSAAASLIPFLEHDDANRALMGSNMQRQAVPLLHPQRPLVGTGIEGVVAKSSGVLAIAKRPGEVIQLDSSYIMIKVDSEHVTAENPDGVDTYELIKYMRSNHNTCYNQKPVVSLGAKVKAGDVLADGPSTQHGELALGRNLLVAFMPWNGYNFEDSILISERIVSEDVFTSIHIQELTCTARDTKLGSEQITADIPNLGVTALSMLDESGIILQGAEVNPGDVLVGKVTPRGETQMTPEERLLHAIFGEKAADVKDSSLKVPSGLSGTVIDVQILNRDGASKDSRTKEIEKKMASHFKRTVQANFELKHSLIVQEISEYVVGKTLTETFDRLKKGHKVTAEDIKNMDFEKISALELGDETAEQLTVFEKRYNHILSERDDQLKIHQKKLAQGDELSPGVIKVVKVYLAIKRRIQPGDKMAGRHGNKGVISKIIPVEDMPYMEDGTPVDIVLNPLGVPSRMNIGQVLESHLGWAAKGLGNKIRKLIEQNSLVAEKREFLNNITAHTTREQRVLDDYTDEEIDNLANVWSSGVPLATPVFDGVSETVVKDLLKLADLPENGKSVLYDGRSGEKFDKLVTVGYMYMLKLNHLVDEKMHARSTGSYSLVTQQPLGGKAQGGGQRFGEMEVWALQAYGAAYTLQEMLTVKSDDIIGRTRMYKNIVDSNLEMEAGVPEAFNVLVKEIQSICINLELKDNSNSKTHNGLLASMLDKSSLHEFDSIAIHLMSSEEIEANSYGEVKVPETINYRTHKPEKYGLFDCAIFGPVRSYECLCGKYKRRRHRGVVCEKCNVEVTDSRVRRHRMGHITLASPVAHIWYLKSLPSRISLMLDMSLKEVDQVLYYEAYVVTDPGMTNLRHGQLLSVQTYYDMLEEHGSEFTAMMGAEGIELLLKKINLSEEVEKLRELVSVVTSETKLKKLTTRLKLAESFLNSVTKPESMIINVLPVLPPDLRPLVHLDGGRFATSDLNDLYRRVINRNNRLKRLLQLYAPEIIIRNEKRMLQEAVDSLIDNGRRGRHATGANKRPLKSLADNIKGKQGRIRQNLLGKRVDFSGRTVITVGPSLTLNQCGLPKEMAMELYKPFVYSRLLLLEHASTIKAAKIMVEENISVVWDVLESVIKQHPILLNRAPTLHRLGIQAFEPTLIEGKALQLHPLVCGAFNADFDGDQMAIHLPLTIEAQLEARCLMMSTNNILSPANGSPVICPTHDVVLGLYYLTRDRIGAIGEGMRFSSMSEVISAYNQGKADLHAKITTRIPCTDDEGNKVQRRYDTTVGRVILWQIFPKSMDFESANQVLDSKKIGSIIDYCYRALGNKKTVIFADRIMSIGYEYATKSGASIGIDDLNIPSQKADLVQKAELQVKEISDQFMSGLVTEGERRNKVIDIWTSTNEKVGKAMMKSMSVEKIECGKTNKMIEQQSFNPVYMMADSGARGSAAQMRQLSGMRGLMSKPDGSIIETPIKANFREGLDVLEYFVSTHGARKGLADTALKTANSGYLTRRLVDVAQDVVVQQEDCGAEKGIILRPKIEGGEVVVQLSEKIYGRVVAEDILDKKGNVIIKNNTMIFKEHIEVIENNAIAEVSVRSPITCELDHGVCSNCYGSDLARGKLVKQGESVGIIAAQSIGEPGTQLTMRTFHIGGAASGAALENHIRVRNKGSAHFEGIKTISKGDYGVVISRSGNITISNEKGQACEKYKIQYGAQLRIANSAKIEVGDVIAEWDPHTHPIISEGSGRVEFVDFEEGVTITKKMDLATGLNSIVVTHSEQKIAGKEYRPLLRILDDKGEQVMLPGTSHPAMYFLPANSVVLVQDGSQVAGGDTLAKIPKESSKTKDITGGLPRVVDLFEARTPKDAAIMAEADGIISFGKPTRDKKRLIITLDNNETKEVLIPKWRNILYFEGEKIAKGEVLADGQSDPHMLLKLLGEEALANYIVDEVQDVYRLQGVRIHDKHIEIIVRQMMRRIMVEDSGSTQLIKGEHVSTYNFNKANKEQSEKAKGRAILLGITRASLATDSFISAASFQDTTRVLTDASISGRVDTLRGLKENVMIGRLIPAGTGYAYHQQRTKSKLLRTERFDFTKSDTDKDINSENIQDSLGEALRQADDKSLGDSIEGN